MRKVGGQTNPCRRWVSKKQNLPTCEKWTVFAADSCVVTTLCAKALRVRYLGNIRRALFLSYPPPQSVSLNFRRIQGGSEKRPLDGWCPAWVAFFEEGVHAFKRGVVHEVNKVVEFQLISELKRVNRCCMTTK